jgi:hypothetical protein
MVKGLLLYKCKVYIYIYIQYMYILDTVYLCRGGRSVVPFVSYFRSRPPFALSLNFSQIHTHARTGCRGRRSIVPFVSCSLSRPPFALSLNFSQIHPHARTGERDCGGEGHTRARACAHAHTHTITHALSLSFVLSLSLSLRDSANPALHSASSGKAHGPKQRRTDASRAPTPRRRIAEPRRRPFTVFTIS